MINSLEIRNYRNLRELRINSFTRINLITGKNNTGKSSLLETIIIYVNKADIKSIYQLLNDRGENYIQTVKGDNDLSLNIRTFASLFTGRKVSYNTQDAISIIANENELPSQSTIIENSLSIRFVKYIDREISQPLDKNIDEPIFKRIIVDESMEEDDVHSGLEINFGNSSTIRTLERKTYGLANRNFSKIGNIQFISTRNIDWEMNGKLWDSITLTDKEEFVIEALRIIEPDIERIAFIDESARQRSAVIKLKDSNNVVPIKSMGDGINRILTIILAMVNVENGYLLIDEFENGLHHTVQRKLWEIIFKLSKKLTIQVFATTHNEDCIKGFETVLNNQENKNYAKLIRLENKRGQINEVEFNAKELEIAANQNIEIR